MLVHPRGRIALRLTLLPFPHISYALFFAAWNTFDTEPDLKSMAETRAVVFTAAIVLLSVAVELWELAVCVVGMRKRDAAWKAAQMVQKQQAQQVRPTGSVQARGADGAAGWATKWSGNSSRIWAGGRAAPPPLGMKACGWEGFLDCDGVEDPPGSSPTFVCMRHRSAWGIG